MLRSYSEGASALALAVALVSLNVPVPRALAQTADQPPAESGAIALPTVEVTATQAGGGGGGPAESPSEKTGYSAPPVQQSTTKIAVPTFDLPVAIATVPEQVIQDQNNISLQDALQNVSGVQTYPTTQNRPGY